jgi:hypothetical protein
MGSNFSQNSEVSWNNLPQVFLKSIASFFNLFRWLRCPSYMKVVNVHQYSRDPLDYIAVKEVHYHSVRTKQAQSEERYLLIRP